MIKTAFTLVLALITSFNFAQTQTESRELLAFDQLIVSHSIEAELVLGTQHQIEIIASGIDLENIETTVVKRVLEVKISGSNPKSSTVKVKITFVKLNQIEVNTAAKVFVKDKIENKSIHLKAATSGYLEVEVKAGTLLLEAQTNAKIFIKGQADNLDYNAFTNAEVDGGGLEVKHAEVRTNTNAFGTFSVLESIEGTAGTRGRVKHKDPSSL